MILLRTPALLSLRHRMGERGSLLITAMLLAAIIGVALVSYLSLGRTTLKLSHRTFFANDAGNLAEAGVEEALYSFNLMGVGTSAATAWTGWTVSGTNATRTLAPFNRDQNAIGTVKLYVKGYDGSDNAPYIVSQATITPFDGSAPIVRTVQVTLRRVEGATANGLVALNGLSIGGSAFADSFNSNPTNSPTGPWASYSSGIAHSNTTVIVMAGSISAGSGSIKGNLKLGKGVAAPSSSVYSGTLTTNYNATFPYPVVPTAASVSQSDNLGATIPATLPRAGDVAASDGRFYYFCSGASIGVLTITSGKNVSIVGTGGTSMTSGLAIQSLATCFIYMDGPMTLTKGNDISNLAWAGGLQICTTTTSTCYIGNKSTFVGCLFAPFAPLSLTGGASSSMIIGSIVAKTVTESAGMDFHYDETLLASNPSTGFGVFIWQEFQTQAERATVGALTGNFLP